MTMRFAIGFHITELRTAHRHHPHGPARMHGRLPDHARGKGRIATAAKRRTGNAHTLTPAWGGHIGCYHQRFDAAVTRPPQQVKRDMPVLGGIKLEPGVRPARLRHIFNGVTGHRAERVGKSVIGSRRCQYFLGPRPDHG